MASLGAVGSSSVRVVDGICRVQCDCLVVLLDGRAVRFGGDQGVALQFEGLSLLLVIGRGSLFRSRGSLSGRARFSSSRSSGGGGGLLCVQSLEGDLEDGLQTGGLDAVLTAVVSRLRVNLERLR